MENILSNFLEITKINRCSFNTSDMQKYIIKKAKEFGYQVKVDSANNILAFVNNPKIAFQAHCDMVCVGKAPKIEPIIEGNILKAKNSSLGADNGVAIAMMFELMKDKTQAEFLFTNDEEVGLIGAKNLQLDIKSPYMLNLDSEDEGEIYIGCAGGVDIKATKDITPIDSNLKYCYEISISNLPGGHSGVDIDKDIPNAIIELSKFIKENNLNIVSFLGGERINSIPANAKAIVVGQNRIESSNLVEVKLLDKSCISYDFDIDEILNLQNGVIDYNSKFNVVQTSANIALLTIKEGRVVLEVSLRSLSNEELENFATLYKDVLKSLGFSVKLNDKYPAWKPEINEFTKIVQNSVDKIFGSSQLKVIHAGLECGILSQKLPNIKMASIGPNIRYPHSIREYVEINSINKTYKVIKEVISLIK